MPGAFSRGRARAKAILRSLNLMKDPGTWIEDGILLACAYPRGDETFATLARRGITVLINLHERGHVPAHLAGHGLREEHLPTRDFTPPTPEDLDRGVAAIVEAVAAGEGVAVHCGAGLGRTGTLIACYLVDQGLDPEAAMDRVRAVRPGSVETSGQVAAIQDFARRRRDLAQP